MGYELISMMQLLISYLQYSSSLNYGNYIPPTAENHDAYSCSLIVSHIILSLALDNVDTA